METTGSDQDFLCRGSVKARAAGRNSGCRSFALQVPLCVILSDLSSTPIIFIPLSSLYVSILHKPGALLRINRHREPSLPSLSTTVNLLTSAPARASFNAYSYLTSRGLWKEQGRLPPRKDRAENYRQSVIAFSLRLRLCLCPKPSHQVIAITVTSARKQTSSFHEYSFTRKTMG